MPALLTRPSSPPKRAAAWATSTMAILPARPAERASCASLSTVARPIPLAAPVTSARMGDSQCNAGAIIEAFDERHAPRRPLARARRPRERLLHPARGATANGRHGAAVVRRHAAAPDA